MWIDIHAHLYDLSAEELTHRVDEARAAGVSLIVNTATSTASACRVIDQCAIHAALLAAVGVSPFDSGGVSGPWIDELRRLLDAPAVIALGEIGLDAARPAYPPLPVQQSVFEQQLDVAMSRGMPVVVHSRGSEKRVLDILRRARCARALFHCYTGDLQTLRSILDNGYYASFSGIVTFRDSPLRPLVDATPLERLFIETDAPYLAPAPFRGKPNRPAWLTATAAAVASIKKIDERSLAEALKRNFDRLFGVRHSIIE